MYMIKGLQTSVRGMFAQLQHDFSETLGYLISKKLTNEKKLKNILLSHSF